MIGDGPMLTSSQPSAFFTFHPWRAQRLQSGVANIIPLFPLDLVLFPCAALPLHIFEPRYQEMVAECLSQKQVFGIARSRKEPASLAAIGCTAQIATVLKLYDDGRMDILTQGRRRFEILETNTERSFMQADVMFLEDAGEPASRAELSEIIRLNRELLKLTETDDPGFTEDLPELSFALTSSLPADLDFKQTILEMNSEKQRIEHLLAYYRFLVPKVRFMRRASKTVHKNGYVM